MSKKLVLILMFTAVLMSLLVGVAYADEDEPKKEKAYFVEDEEMGSIPIFGDGRLNAFDMTQSFAVYFDTALEVWVVDPVTCCGQLALYVTMSEINMALKSTVDVEIASAKGVTLYYLPGLDSFKVTGPRGYTFMWER